MERKKNRVQALRLNGFISLEKIAMVCLFPFQRKHFRHLKANSHIVNVSPRLSHAVLIGCIYCTLTVVHSQHLPQQGFSNVTKLVSVLDTQYQNMNYLRYSQEQSPNFTCVV
jgi:cell division protein FtsL